MKNKYSTWKSISNDLNKMEIKPSIEVWEKISNKNHSISLNLKRKRIQYIGLAASFLLAISVFSIVLNKRNSYDFEGYYYQTNIDKSEAEVILSSISFSKTHLTFGEIGEGNMNQMLIPKVQ